MTNVIDDVYTADMYVLLKNRDMIVCLGSAYSRCMKSRARERVPCLTHALTNHSDHPLHTHSAVVHNHHLLLHTHYSDDSPSAAVAVLHTDYTPAAAANSSAHTVHVPAVVVLHMDSDLAVAAAEGSSSAPVPTVARTR